MNCENLRELFPEYLMAHLDTDTREKIDAHVSRCNECKQQLEQLNAVWNKLGTIPEEEPSPILRNRFYSMLDAYQQGLNQARRATSWREIWHNWINTRRMPKPAFQLALALLCLTAGFLIGRKIDYTAHPTNEIAQLRNEIMEMRQMVSLSLLNQPSSSERLRGVSWSYRVHQPAEQLLFALLNTLNSDPNVNVRLAAVDALYLFCDNEKTRNELIQSLAKQPSPLVQIALIDLLVEIREKKSLDALRNLIEDQKINQSVKQRAEWGIKQLI